MVHVLVYHVSVFCRGDNLSTSTASSTKQPGRRKGDLFYLFLKNNEKNQQLNSLTCLHEVLCITACIKVIRNKKYLRITLYSKLHSVEVWKGKCRNNVLGNMMYPNVIPVCTVLCFIWLKVWHMTSFFLSNYAMPLFCKATRTETFLVCSFYWV